MRKLCTGSGSGGDCTKECRVNPVVDIIKLFLPKLRNWKTFVLMSEPALKCENNAIFKSNYA